MLVQQLFWGVGLPAMVAIAVPVIAFLLCRHRKRSPGVVADGLGLGIAYIAGHFALFGWRGLIPKEGWEYLPHIAVVVTVVGMLIASARVPRWMGWGVAVLAVIVIAWLLVPYWQESRLFWIMSLASVAIVLWGAMHALAVRTSVASSPLLVLVAALATAAILERAATARFAQLAGVLAASAGGCLVVASLVSGVKPRPGLAGTGAVLLVGLVFTGKFSHFSDVPTVCFLLVVAAPLMAWLGQWGPIRRRKTWQRLMFEAVAVLVPVAVALGLAFAATDLNG